MRLLLTEAQADALADALENEIEAAHEASVEHDRDSEDFKYARDQFRALAAVLEQVDPENPILMAGARVGHEFDWEQFWKQIDEQEVEDLDVDEEPSLSDRIADDAVAHEQFVDPS